MSLTSSMIHYAQWCLHNLSLASVHGVTLSHPLKHQCPHLQMPCSMKDSYDPLHIIILCDACILHMLSFVVQHCCWLFNVRVCHCPSSVSTVWLSCYQWRCSPALVGSHVAVVLEWCSVLMDSGSHSSFCGWVVCCHWGWQYHWCGQWWLWWKKCYVQTQRWYLTCHWLAMWLKGDIYNIPFVVLGHIAWYLLHLNSVCVT